MALEKRIEVNQVEVVEAGVVQLRIAKIIADGDNVLSKEWHRTSFAVGGDVLKQMAIVNAHLVEMGWPELPAGTADTIAKYAAVAWSPDKVAAATAIVDVELEAKRAELVQIEADKAAVIAAANEELARLTESANQIIAAAQAA